MRLNIGCGQTPTQGWRNFDNSLSVRLARFKYISMSLYRLGLLSDYQWSFIQFASKSGIEFGNAVEGLPIQAGAVDALYSSHMLEHLDRCEVAAFLSESMRLLKPYGLIRLVVPDLRLMVERYIASGDADAFVSFTGLAAARPRGLLGTIKRIIVGDRNHLWLYDGTSLTKVLADHGFVEIRVLPAGQTGLESSQVLNLFERADESLYVEARKPRAL